MSLVISTASFTSSCSLIIIINILNENNFFFYLGFLSLNIHKSQGNKGRGRQIETLFCHFHPIHKHFDISQTIVAESSFLHIGSDLTRTENFWFPCTSCQLLSYAWRTVALTKCTKTIVLQKKCSYCANHCGVYGRH